MKTRKGEPVIVVPEEQQQIVELERQLAEARQECQRLRQACIQTEREVQQALGKALGYPWCKDAPNIFPGSTEADGVFVGEHTAETLATEIAERLKQAESERDDWQAEALANRGAEEAADELRNQAVQNANTALREKHALMAVLLLLPGWDKEATVEQNWQRIIERAEQAEAERDELIKEFGEFKQEQREYRDKMLTKRDELKRKLDACQCETRVLNESMLIEVERERDQLAAEAVRLGSLRPEVLTFASVMEYVLQNNDDKGDWKDCGPEWLLGRLEDEVRELREALRVNLNRAFMNETEIRYEAADVANFAMMIADVCGALAATPHAAKAAERVRKLEAIIQITMRLVDKLPELMGEPGRIGERKLTLMLDDDYQLLSKELAEYCTLSVLDKPEVQEWKCPNPNCINGAEDTGGVTPWDEPILIPCPACQDRKRNAAMYAERVQAMENVVNEARAICNLMEALTREGNELAEVDFAAFAELCTAIDALDRLDATGVAEGG